MASSKSKDNKFIVSSTEVRVPTLLIGIGGIGGRIVSSVFDQLDVKDRSTVEMLVLDTNINDLGDVEKKGIKCLQTSDNKTVQQYLAANPKFCEWFPSNPLINSKNLIDGAGQIRAVSRLGGLSSEQAGNFDDIKKGIDELNRERGEDAKKTLKVMIVGSITGGTGSGIGLQLPYYIRDLLKETANVLVRGLFLTADITEEKQQTSNSKKAVFVNEYAFIRELNAFYRAQMVPKEEVRINVEHYNKCFRRNDIPALQTANPVPYDFMFILEKNSNKSKNLGGLATYESKAAKIVRSQLFSPVSGGQYSAEDNLIIPMVENNGMNRYCGAGFSSAIYPQEHVERYCTLKFASNSVSNLWLYLDKKFKDANQEHKNLMKVNPSLAPLRPRKFYADEFRKMTEPNNRDAIHYIAQLSREIKRVEYDEDGTKIDEKSTVDALISEIQAYLKKSLDETGVAKKGEKCVFESSQFASYGDAIGNARSLLHNISAYDEATKSAVDTISVTCAEAILPSTLQKKGNMEHPYSIYDCLRNCHPLSARYLIYTLIEQMSIVKERMYEQGINSGRPDGIKGRDFYPQDSDKDTIIQAIGKARPGVIRTLVNEVILQGANLNSSKYNNIIKEFGEAVEAERGYIESEAIKTLGSNVFTAVIERLEVLAHLYEDFFAEMEKIVSDCEHEIEVLASKYSGDDKRRIDGDWYICADEICLNSIYSEINKNLSSDPNELSLDVKETLFQEIYGEMLKRRAKENDIASDVGKDKSMKEIFEKGVLTPMSIGLFAEGGQYTDIGVLGAIKREFKAYKVAAENIPGFEMPADSEGEYLRKIFKRISELATPYIAYTAYNGEQLPVAVSYGVNTSVICDYFGVTADKLLKSQVEELFRQTGVDDNSPISADSFSKNELHCYKAVYNLNVENLNRYADGSTAHQYYKERIECVVDNTYGVSSEEDSYLTIVHPHLDKRWNSRAFLPLLNKSSDIREGKFVNLAFLLSFVLNVCKYGIDYDKGECWRYINEDKVTSIYTNRDEVINSNALEALLDGFNYNDIVKRDVLLRVLELQVYAEKNEVITGTTEQTIITHPIIKQACDIGDFGVDSDTKIKTIFDIIYVIYCKTRDEKMTDAMRLALAGYLADYCYAMANRKAVSAKKLLRCVVDKINNDSANYLEAKVKAPDFIVAWDSTFKDEKFEDNLNYLELVDYLIDM